MQQFPVSLDTLIAFVRAIHPEGDPLDHLADAVRVSLRLDEQADSLIGHFVDQARHSGASWSQIGESMGVTKQAVQKRFVSRASDILPGTPERLFSRFAERARRSLIAARRIAADGQPVADDAASPTPVQPRHIVAGLLTESDGIAARAVSHLGIDRAAVLDALDLAEAEGVEPASVAGSDASPEGVRSVTFDDEAKRLIARSLDVALHYGHNYIGTEHLILSAVAEGPTAAPLTKLGLGLDALRDEIERLLAEHVS